MKWGLPEKENQPDNRKGNTHDQNVLMCGHKDSSLNANLKLIREQNKSKNKG